MRRADRADYEWVFRAAFPRIHRTVALILRDDDVAQEVTQDAFLQLLQNWRKVSSYEQPEAWVRRVAIRMAVRRAGREAQRVVRECERGHGVGQVHVGLLEEVGHAG